MLEFKENNLEATMSVEIQFGESLLLIQLYLK